MPNIAKIKKFVDAAVRRELPSTKVVKVNMYEGESSIDGSPIFHIDVVCEGEEPRPEEFENLCVLTHRYFGDAYEESMPLFTFLSTEEVSDYYDPARKWPPGYYAAA